MIGRMIVPALFGVVGCAILISLGVWQLNRAEEKAELIREMEMRIFDAPVALPRTLSPEEDRYRPVEVAGRLLPEHTFVLAAQRDRGPGFHLISAFETDTGRRIMIERGFLREADRDAFDLAPQTEVALIGNLHWPRDSDRFTPDHDVSRNLHFARDVPELARQLDTEPVLVVLRDSNLTDPHITPVPVNAVSIPDNHIGYAVQWFLMALAWAGMTLFFLWRISAQRD
ncbi:MAG: SURF1 family protein [Rhodobacteraceae bacterium]|nr:MAG: SURF1 family protein [Paracoccaceae bacterium]